MMSGLGTCFPVSSTQMCNGLTPRARYHRGCSNNLLSINSNVRHDIGFNIWRSCLNGFIEIAHIKRLTTRHLYLEWNRLGKNDFYITEIGVMIKCFSYPIISDCSAGAQFFFLAKLSAVYRNIHFRGKASVTLRFTNGNCRPVWQVQAIVSQRTTA